MGIIIIMKIITAMIIIVGMTKLHHHYLHYHEDYHHYDNYCSFGQAESSFRLKSKIINIIVVIVLVVGVSTAYHLARRGHDVLLLEKTELTAGYKATSNWTRQHCRVNITTKTKRQCCLKLDHSLYRKAIRFFSTAGALVVITV